MKLDRSEYRAYPALNASYLKQVYSKSYWHAEIPVNATPAMKLGTLAHSTILEPSTVEDEYAVFMGDKRTKDGKALWAEIEASGRTPITAEDSDKVGAMRQVVMCNAESAALLHGGIFTEYSCTFESPYFADLLCKAQIDLYTRVNDQDVLVDLKTTASLKTAQKAFFDLGYDLQLAFYRDALIGNGFAVDKVQIMFVETSAPYQVAVWDVPEEVLQNGVEKIKIAIEKYQRQREFAFPEVLTGTIEMPPWVRVETAGEDSPFLPLKTA